MTSLVRRVHLDTSDPIVKSIALALTVGVLAGISRSQFPTDRKA